MNRLVVTSDTPIDPASLPATRREAGAPARALFLHGLEVGFATTAGNLEHFAALRPDLDAVHVRLVMPRWLRLFCTQSPVPVGELDYRYLRHMFGWRRYLRTLLGPGRPFDTARFDVVHVMTQQRALIVRDFVRRSPAAARPRFMVNLDATLRNWESMRGMRRLAPPIDWAMEGSILRSADALACATAWVERSAVGESGVDRARVVIHKPCARVAAPAVPAVERPRAAGEPLNILFVGGVWTDKGGPRLLRWHQERWADRARLHIVSGEAPADASARNVVFHGRVPHEKLVGEFLPQMDLFVVPTRWDTFMIAAQEAQAAGMPVVTTRTGGVPEVVRDGVTGFLCPAGDDAAYISAVERLLDDDALRLRMGRAAMEHARTALSADVWHNHLLDALVALANHQPPRRWPSGLPEEPAPAAPPPPHSPASPAPSVHA